MNNKEIPTTVGTTLLIIIGITIGVFVWTYEKEQNWDVMAVQTQPLKNTDSEIVEKNKKSDVIPLVVAKPATEWQKVCKNVSAGYQVKYPDEWTAKIGNAMDGHRVIKDCGASELFSGKDNTIKFSPVDPSKIEEQVSGIWITAFPNATQQSFIDPTTELLVDGEKMTWVHRNGGRLLYHGTTKYEVVVYDDVSEELVTEFFSTFKFLP